MNATTTCLYEYQLVAGTVDSYPVVSSSTCNTVQENTTSTSSIGYNGPNGAEFLVVSCVIIFFLSIVGWRNIFGGAKYLNDNPQ